MDVRFEINLDTETGHYYICFLNERTGEEIDFDETKEKSRIPLILKRMIDEYDWSK